MEKSNKPQILAIVGPTASGKTALSVRLAKDLGGEIVSCDSMQVYRGMNIGTAKPDTEERAGVPHHMIDVVDAAASFSSADYAKMARECVKSILSAGKLPIFCGGTGLYLDAFLRGDDSSGAGADEEYRAQLGKLALEEGADFVYRMLEDVDPESAKAVHPNNVKRVIRALEVYHTTGVKKSELDKLSKLRESEYDMLTVGLRYTSRNVLYERIDKRVDAMLEAGLCDEVRALEEAGVFERSKTASQAIGYKELLGYIRGERPYDVCVEELKMSTRRYAKRQMTWFGRDEKIKWIDIDFPQGKTFEDIVNIAEKLFSDFHDCAIM